MYPAQPGWYGGAPTQQRYPPLNHQQQTQQTYQVQMMQLHMRILEARKVNIEQKRRIAQAILANRSSIVPELPVVQPAVIPQLNSLVSSHTPPVDRVSKLSTGASPADISVPIIRSRSGSESMRELESSEYKPKSSREQAPSEVMALPRQNYGVNQKLHSLSEVVSSTVDDYSMQLKTAINDQLPINKRNKVARQAAQARHKQDIESLLQNKGNQRIEILPRWKHLHLYNNANPNPATVLRPYRLFRVIAWAIAYIITGPLLGRFKRRLKHRERDRRELKRTIDLFVENVDDWIGKSVQLPLSTIVQDASLDFDPKDTYGTLRARMLQLKVRIRAIIQNICTMPMPPPHITTYLSTLVTDGNYFPDEFLWLCENTAFDFDRLGATRGMIVEVDPLFVSRSKYTSQVQVTDEQPSDGASPEVKVKVVDVTKARALLVNFLLVRVLIFRLGLTPWHCGLCSPPANRHTRRVVANLRILSTLLYKIARIASNGLLPPVPENNTMGDITEQVKPNKKANDSKGFAAGRLLSLGQTADNTDSPDQDKGDDHNADQAENPEVDSKGIASTILRMIGLHDRPGREVFKQDSIEFLLIQPKTVTYCSLETLHALLLSDGQLGGIDALANEWIDDLIEPLNTWFQHLVDHIVSYQHISSRKENAD